MPEYIVSLDTLTARYDAIADGRERGDSRPVYTAILDRLADNRRLAEAAGWTECALERVGGRLFLAGVAPGGGRGRAEIPDLSRGGG